MKGILMVIVLFLLWPGLAFGQWNFERQMEKLQEQRRFNEWQMQMERQRQQQERFQFEDRMDRMTPRSPVIDPLRDYYLMQEMIKDPYWNPYPRR